MFPIEFSDRVEVTGPDGSVHAALLDGIIQQVGPESAELGHGELLLAYQRWSNVKLRVDASLEFGQGEVTFSDGSRRGAMLTRQQDSERDHIYLVTLSAL